MSSRLLRCLGTIALPAFFGLVFWAAATLAASLPGLVILGVNVHGLGLASYAGDSAQRPAPLSLQLLDDARRDAGGSVGASPDPATTTSIPSVPVQPSPRPAPTPTPTVVPISLPTPTPLPTPVLPTPTPVPTPTPLPTPIPLPTPPLPAAPTPAPTPTPGLLPLPLPIPIPILPSLLPGLLR